MRTTRVPGVYFDQVIWPAYVKHNRSIVTDKDIFVLDGSGAKDDLLQSALNFIVKGRSDSMDDSEGRQLLRSELDRDDL